MHSRSPLRLYYPSALVSSAADRSRLHSIYPLTLGSRIWDDRRLYSYTVRLTENQPCLLSCHICQHACFISELSLLYGAFISTSVTLTASAAHRACKVPVGHLLGTPPSGSRRSNGAPTGLTTASACNRSMGSCLASA